MDLTQVLSFRLAKEMLSSGFEVWSTFFKHGELYQNAVYFVHLEVPKTIASEAGLIEEIYIALENVIQFLW